MTNRAITALNITPASYANRRGNQRLAALSEIIGWLATADAADLAAMTNLDDLRAIADMALGRNGNKGSESKELRQRAEQLDGLIARAAGLAEQAEADAKAKLEADAATDAKLHKPAPMAALNAMADKLGDNIKDEQAAAEQIETTLNEAPTIDGEPVGQPSEFDGLSEAAVRVLHAILRSLGDRVAVFFDEIPVAELGRMTAARSARRAMNCRRPRFWTS